MTDFSEILRAEETGDFINAFDLAIAFANEPDHDEIRAAARYIAVRSLARSGATEAARDLFDAFHLGEVSDEDHCALDARLLKDAALSHPGETQGIHLYEAANAYRRVFDQFGGHYPAVNAATCYALAGMKDLAGEMARTALDACTAETPTSDMARYYNAASRAEANIVLEALGDAMAALHQASEILNSLDMASMSSVGEAARSGTRKQLRLLLDAGGFADDILTELSVPDVLHYCGHMMSSVQGATGGDFTEEAVAARIAAYFDDAFVGHLYGSLACGVDILVVEEALRRPDSVVDIHVFLPFEADSFIHTSVRPGGADWVRRFMALQSRIGDANRLRIVGNVGEAGDEAMFAYCSRVAMGQAALRAQQIDSEVRQLAVWDGIETNAVAGTAADVRAWKDTGYRLDEIRVRRQEGAAPSGGAADAVGEPAVGSGPAPDRAGDGITTSTVVRHAAPARSLKALLFADVAGFGGLLDRDLPRFHDIFMRQISVVLKRHAQAVRYRNSWGDAIYLVFEGAAACARCALDIRDAARTVDLVGASLPDTLGLRIGLHYGPVFHGTDHVLSAELFFGAHVTKTARIEPVTPIGEVYVTEEFAAELALDPATAVGANYVGHVDTAKRYGAFRMYHLHRTRPRKAPEISR